MELDRRRLLGAGLMGAATMLLPPEKLFAAMLPADWTLGVADVEADVT